jgi:hypothetical protein
MGKCCLFCLYPQLPVEASQHRCANCGNKFHGLCSDVKHPRADELQLTMGNDHLCPSCAWSIGAVAVHSIGSESPFIVVQASRGKNQIQLAIHSLPPGVKITNSLAADGVKCHFTKQSKCKFKNTEIVCCIRCDNAVHVQCFFHLILDSKDSKVSIDIFFSFRFLLYFF